MISFHAAFSDLLYKKKYEKKNNHKLNKNQNKKLHKNGKYLANEYLAFATQPAPKKICV